MKFEFLVVISAVAVVLAGLAAMEENDHPCIRYGEEHDILVLIGDVPTIQTTRECLERKP